MFVQGLLQNHDLSILKRKIFSQKIITSIDEAMIMLHEFDSNPGNTFSPVFSKLCLAT